MKSEWEKIIIARAIELVLTLTAFGIGAWHTIKSSKLEEKLDSHFEDEETENDE